jgi:hypothetical protein
MDYYRIAIPELSILLKSVFLLAEELSRGFIESLWRQHIRLRIYI